MIRFLTINQSNAWDSMYVFVHLHLSLIRATRDTPENRTPSKGAVWHPEMPLTLLTSISFVWRHRSIRVALTIVYFSHMRNRSFDLCSWTVRHLATVAVIYNSDIAHTGVDTHSENISDRQNQWFPRRHPIDPRYSLLTSGTASSQISSLEFMLRAIFLSIFRMLSRE